MSLFEIALLSQQRRQDGTDYEALEQEVYKVFGINSSILNPAKVLPFSYRCSNVPQLLTSGSSW